jgi:hypothetical protein
MEKCGIVGVQIAGGPKKSTERDDIETPAYQG